MWQDAPAYSMLPTCRYNFSYIVDRATETFDFVSRLCTVLLCKKNGVLAHLLTQWKHSTLNQRKERYSVLTVQLNDNTHL